MRRSIPLRPRLASRRLAPLCLALCLFGCEGALELAIDLRTDLVPAVEADDVRIEWRMLGGPSLGTRTTPLEPTRDYLTGARVAELSGLAPGTYRIELTMLEADRALVTRETIVELRNNAAVTVRITRDCAGVSCSGELSTCLDGECVAPACRPDAPERCPSPSCVVDGDCPSPAVLCFAARCAAGVCFEVPDDALCPGTQRCDPGNGCVGPPIDEDAGPPPDGGRDAGPPPDGGDCEATERCMPGVDADCDGLVFCADPDCAAMVCDDGDACTHGDACGAGVCAGAPVSCTSDACTTRTCNGSATCTEMREPDSTPCDDDGNACTSDTCSAGVCTHPARADGHSLGGTMRCCGGSATNLATDENNCGACGLSCSSGFDCTLSDGHPTCDCSTANTQCHGGGANFLCSTTYGVCACLRDQACPGSATCAQVSGQADYCTY